MYYAYQFRFFLFLAKKKYRVTVYMGVVQCAQYRPISTDTILDCRLKLQSGAVRFEKLFGSNRSLPSWMMCSSKDGEDDSTKKKHAGTSHKVPDFLELLVPIYSPLH
jgi:hypothetical protein